MLLKNPVSTSYTKAYEDIPFLKSDEARSIRLQLELLKPELALKKANIEECICCFGSARIRDKKESAKRIKDLEAKLKKNPKNKELQIKLKEAKGLASLSKYYDEARKFSYICVSETKKRFSIVTGGGPGIMEAANRGAYEAGGTSIGFNITLPMEQKPNKYITKGFAFLFHYFAVRKMHLVMRSKAVVVFPGGYGTFDEMFEILTLVQTGKKKKIPVVLVGKEFWNSIFNVQKLFDYGVISYNDTFAIVDTAEEAVAVLKKFYHVK